MLQKGPGRRPLWPGEAEEAGTRVPGRATAQELPQGTHPVLRRAPRGRQNQRRPIYSKHARQRVPQVRTVAALHCPVLCCYS